MSNLISMILYMVMSVMVLLSVAFLTLLERKILGYIQVRKGPNKVLGKGTLQPIMDALKLFSKELSVSVLFNKLLYNFLSFFSLFLTLMMWLIFSFNMFEEFLLSLLYIFVLMSMSIYWLMGSGWASNSKYTLLGCYRSGAQVISYEVGLIFLFLCFFEFSGFFSINVQLWVMIKSYKFIFVFWFMFVVWLTILMAEMNRAPFDFAESESELVSGFNVEYGGSKFAFLFLAEYGSLLLMAYLTLLIFMSNLIFFYMLVIFLIVWVRGVFPRYRYDNLMYLNWKVFLPFILFIFLNIIVLKNLLV